MTFEQAQAAADVFQALVDPRDDLHIGQAADGTYFLIVPMPDGGIVKVTTFDPAAVRTAA